MFRCPVKHLSHASKRAAILLPVYLLAAGSALALDCSAIVVDRGDLLSFGQARLGDPPSRLPADVSAPRACGETCEYVDRAGTTYVVKGEEIVRKEIPEISLYQGRLPARIAVTDSLQTILMRLAAFSEGTPIWSLAPLPGGGLLLRTDNCIQGSNGVRGSYGFTFDREGRLVSISAEVL